MPKNTAQTKITPRTIEALRILRDIKPQTAAQFAELFWPGNDMHTRHSNCGTHGARRGAGAWLAAGSYLGALERRGLIYKRHITTSHEHPIATLRQAGSDALREAEAKKETHA
jgi:hypothetical protein